MSFESSFAKIGCRISVENGQARKEGYAVIYPSRYSHTLWGGNENNSEGRSELKRYILFCEKELLKGMGSISREDAGAAQE